MLVFPSPPKFAHDSNADSDNNEKIVLSWSIEWRDVYTEFRRKSLG
jgi:hypothetical protein